MIPDLPEGITDEQALDYYAKIAGNLQDQGSIHIRWFTHRGNPSVCWICDMSIIHHKILELTGRLITKSTVDLETTSMSESETDSEIETDVPDSYENPEPEYEVEE